MGPGKAVLAMVYARKDWEKLGDVLGVASWVLLDGWGGKYDEDTGGRDAGAGRLCAKLDVESIVPSLSQAEIVRWAFFLFLARRRCLWCFVVPVVGWGK